MNATILITDPAATVRSLVRHILESEDFSVEEACNGAEAIVALEQRPPALVLADLDLPPSGSPDSIMRLCRRDGIPIVALALRPDIEVARAWLAQGCMALLAKPIGAADLVAAVRTVLTNSAAVRSSRCTRSRK